VRGRSFLQAATASVGRGDRGSGARILELSWEVSLVIAIAAYIVTCEPQPLLG
jgi:hypothetical protein